MHEYSLVQAMFDQIYAIARAQRAPTVRAVRVRIGDRAGVEPALFQTAYDVYRVHTICENAPLAIEPVTASDELVLQQVDLEVP
jgi:hydrogenase nickel incorporation protein HypA/HybF